MNRLYVPEKPGQDGPISKMLKRAIQAQQLAQEAAFRQRRLLPRPFKAPGWRPTRDITHNPFTMSDLYL